MPENEQVTQVDANPPPQTPTGEIKDQSPPPPPKAETKPATTSTPTTTEKSAEPDKPSLLNEKAPEGAPEKYEDFKVPDGFTLDPKVAEEAGAMFKGMGLSQNQAQTLIDYYVQKSQESLQQPYNAYRDMREGWVKEVKADPEIGGKLDQVKTTVARAIDGLGDPKLAGEFREAMDFTGAGDNPAFIKVFFKLAQMVTEGGRAVGGAPAPVRAPGTRPASAAQVLYPNLPSSG